MGIGLTWSQNYFEDMKKMAKIFSSSSQLTVDMQVSMYHDPSETQKQNLGEALIRKDGNKYYTKFNGTEFISDGVNTVIINHSYKTMTLYNEFLDLEKSKQKFADLDFEKWAKKGDSVTYLGSTSGNKRYLIMSKDPFIDRYVITISPSNLLKNITYYYKELGDEQEMDMDHVSIEYVKMEPKMNGNYFSLEKYVSNKNGQWKPSNSYLRYQLEVIN